MRIIAQEALKEFDDAAESLHNVDQPSTWTPQFAYKYFFVDTETRLFKQRGLHFVRAPTARDSRSEELWNKWLNQLNELETGFLATQWDFMYFDALDKYQLVAVIEVYFKKAYCS